MFFPLPLASAIESQISTNLTGAIYLARSTAARMISQRTSTTTEKGSASTPSGGRMIFISSIVGLDGHPGQSVYAASKAGLHGLTLSLAKELGSRRITVNCVCPGYIETAMTQQLPESARQAIVGRIPAGRMGTPEEVAHTVAHLCAPQASYITGQILAVAGGLRL